MTEPLRPAAAPSPAPATIELEPIVITARAPTTVAAPPPVGEIAVNCASKLVGAALALLARPAHPAVGVLVGLKAGLELGECINETIGDASLRQARELCADLGGTEKSFINGTLTCEVPEQVSE